MGKITSQGIHSWGKDEFLQAQRPCLSRSAQGTEPEALGTTPPDSGECQRRLCLKPQAPHPSSRCQRRATRGGVLAGGVLGPRGAGASAALGRRLMHASRHQLLSLRLVGVTEKRKSS